MAYINNQVYWTGTDGNIYLKTGDTVRNMGKALGVSNSGFDAANGSAEASRINDPNPRPITRTVANATAPSNPNSSSGGGSSINKSNDIALQLAGLAAVDKQTKSGIAAVNRALASLMSQYDSEKTANEQNYTQQSDTNQNNYQRGRQTAMVNGANDRRGLFGTLASIGALNGSGIELASRALQKGVSDDLSGVSDNFGTNQTALDTAIGTFRREDDARRKNAQVAGEDAITGVKYNSAKNKQSFYSNLSNDYADMGNASEAARYSGLAASLYPDLAKTSIPSSNIAYSGATFTPTTLSNYLSSGSSTSVTTPVQQGTAIPGLLVSTNKKKSQMA